MSRTKGRPGRRSAEQPGWQPPPGVQQPPSVQQGRQPPLPTNGESKDQDRLAEQVFLRSFSCTSMFLGATHSVESGEFDSPQEKQGSLAVGK
jgi:hypothetical protein